MNINQLALIMDSVQTRLSIADERKRGGEMTVVAAESKLVSADSRVFAAE